MFRLVVSLVFFCLGFSLQGEEMLLKVQRELRTRKYYFGEIDGRASDETLSAIKKFQTAKGIDNTGNLDGETARALGLPVTDRSHQEELRVISECEDCLLRYLQALQGGDWTNEAPFFADEVDYYYDRKVNRNFIREVRAAENRRWPQRKATILNRIVSPIEGKGEQAQATARIRMQVGSKSGANQVRIEDIVFRLRKVEGVWRINALKLLE